MTGRQQKMIFFQTKEIIQCFVTKKAYLTLWLSGRFHKYSNIMTLLMITRKSNLNR